MVIRSRLITCLLLLICGCSGLPEAREPLSAPGSEPYDQRILGSWFGGPPDEDGFYIHLKPRSEPNMLDGTGVLIAMEARDFSSSDATEITWSTAVVHPSHMGGRTYYNVRRLAGHGNDYGSAEDRTGYIVLRVDLIDDHRLNLCVMDISIVEKAIEQGVIKGSVVEADKSKNIQLDYPFMDVSSAQLTDFVQQGEASGLFDACLLFGKVKPSSSSR